MDDEVFLRAQQRNDLANFLTQRGDIHSRNRHGSMDFSLAGTTQAVARAADGEALLVQQLADTPDQQHLMVVVVAAGAAGADPPWLGGYEERGQERGRGGEIRTRDHLHPMQVRYQAALRPEGADYNRAVCMMKCFYAPSSAMISRTS